MVSDNLNNESEFDFIVNESTIQPHTNAEKISDVVGTTPFFPSKVHDNIPEILRERVDKYTDMRSRDLVTLSCLVTVSGQMNNIVTFLDDRSEMKPNLMGFIVAPPASNKGVMREGERILASWDEELRGEYRTALNEYEAQKAYYEACDNKDNVPKPIAPIAQKAFLAGNSSNSAFIQALRDNRGAGTVIETEADTLSKAAKQDWGIGTDIMRQLFHNESIRVLRKKDRKEGGGVEEIFVSEPAASILLSGTPGQVSALIPDVENGLFSRMLFYTYENISGYKRCGVDRSRNSRQRPIPEEQQNARNMTTIMQSLRSFGDQTGNIVVEPTDRQMNEMHEFFETTAEKMVSIYGDDFRSVAWRQKPMIIKLSQVLTILRLLGDGLGGDLKPVIAVDDQSWTAAMGIIQTTIQHSGEMFMRLRRKRKAADDSSAEFFEMLPAEFSRAEAIEVGVRITMSPSSVDRRLRSMTNSGALKKQEVSGRYKKV